MADNFRHLVRVAQTDLDGNKRPVQALQKIKGVSAMFANALTRAVGLNPQEKIGSISDQDFEKLNAAIKDPAQYGIPAWLLNRRKDYETGADLHLVTGDLQFQKENDIKRMKKLKSWRGVRHASGLPLRGQRTKSNFRRHKKRTALGVRRK